MKYLLLLTGNKLLIAALVGWFIAQSLKVLICLIQYKKFDVHRLVGTGGMPSSHSAFVTSLATSAANHYGLDSPIFAISVVLAFVVMYDAAGVRRAAGEQAKIINYMMEHWAETTPDRFQKELKELLGHTPVEVFAGALLGILVGILI